jgi:hypothetical protein
LINIIKGFDIDQETCWPQQYCRGINTYKIFSEFRHEWNYLRDILSPALFAGVILSIKSYLSMGELFI